MNSKNVLSKIMTLLSMDKEDILEFTEAKSADGTILTSPTFDLNEDVEEVHEDGTKTPAKDGEYTISLKDTEGNENVIRIQVKDGKIVERANEEEEKNEPEEMEDSAPMATPSTEVSMAVNEKVVTKGTPAEKGTAHALPNTTDEDPRNRIGDDTDDKKDPIIALSYRITELEEMLNEVKMSIGELTDRKDTKGEAEVKTESDVKMSEVDEEEVDVPKLDGAPIEEFARVNLSAKTQPKLKEGNYQSSFLSKLYN